MDKPLFNNIVFIKSIVRIDQLPEIKNPEIAFIGRSNVGKSTLINTICGRKNIAKISATPGKTKQINFYLVNDSFYFVDLPGYGYSKLPKELLESWTGLIEQYLLKSNNLLLIFLLIDSRHELMKSDIEMIEWLKHNNLPFTIVLTKMDKISKSKQRHQVNFFKSILPDNHVLGFSIKNEILIIALSKFIYNILNSA